MADVFSKEKRSEVMSKIKGSKTKPELKLKTILDGRIFRYQPEGIIGKPDFGNKTGKIAVFIDGCFWHGCKKCRTIPKTNRRFWAEKIKNNKKRDKEVNKRLKELGYKVVRIWEHEIKKDPKKAAEKIRKSLKKKPTP